MSRVLVTGGAGYIGSHMVLGLIQSGHQPIVLDNLISGHRELVEALGVHVVAGDIQDSDLLDRLFAEHSISAVMHFAAYAYVGESVKDPAKYYWNNVAGTVNLLNSMVKAGIKNLIFSSTCATYGIPQELPVEETAIQSPINPYGRSKLMVEQILRDFEVAHGIRSIVFRYFNAAGADPQGRLGELHDPETRLIPLAIQTALGVRKSLEVYGRDYNTPDGSCIRDYVHVMDIASAHLAGLQHIENGNESDEFNLGNGIGFSVFDVIKTVEKLTGKTLKIELVGRRLGDPPRLYCTSAKAKKILGWSPAFHELETIIGHSLAWQRKILTLPNRVE